MSIVILDFTNVEVYIAEYVPALDVEYQIKKLFENMLVEVTLNNCHYMVVENTNITFYQTALQR